jgi:hypothetical protein
MCTGDLKSWVIEGSLDGKVWRKIDRKTGNKDFKSGGWPPGSFSASASFAVSKPAECRFIRLTQTGWNHGGGDDLVMWSLEFFGTLRE